MDSGRSKLMHHYEDDDKCPILLTNVGGDNIFDVLSDLGNPFDRQDQVCKDGDHCYLLRADISPFRELDKFKVATEDAPQYLKDIVGDDLSLATLAQVRIICINLNWCEEIGE